VFKVKIEYVFVLQFVMVKLTFLWSLNTFFEYQQRKSL